MKIPKFLAQGLLRVSQKEARETWEWLQSNSNTVIVDELEITLRMRRDWKEIERKEEKCR